MWTIWKSRNDMVFNDKLVGFPAVMVHNMLALLNYWKPLVKTKNLQHLEEVLGKAKEHLGRQCGDIAYNGKR
ncbi:hypothetical protein PVAP13_1NG039224 [Panicum virgatum]|uniref:Uncharacterized protein n=1 Tax=Panicum virgatum TaxID=38727 RepID=A0A8T0WJX5_PANVG|nr:hypothetical protein PVAP13_1NG039224 [Panicum virgatum]